MHRSISFPALIGAIVLAAGCDDQPREIPAAAQPVAPAHEAVYRERSQDPVGQGIVEVDGRRIEVQRIVHESWMDDNLLGTSDYYQVVDAESRQPILPRQGKIPENIPGRGLFLHAAKETIFTRLNVQTGEQMPTDIVAIMDYHMCDADAAAIEAREREYEPAIVAKLADELMEPLHVLISDRRVAEILSPKGVLLGTYTDFLSLTPVGPYHVLRAQHADGTREQHLFSRFFDPMFSVSAVQEFYRWTPPRARFDGDMREFNPGDGTIIGIPAPNTAPADDLWLLQGEEGFGAPPGVIGMRPVDCYDWRPTLREFSIKENQQRDVDRWLLRFAREGEVDARGKPGKGTLAWGFTDGCLKTIPAPTWKSADILVAPDQLAYEKNGDFDKGWSKPFLLLQDPQGTWLTCYLFADPSGDPNYLPDYGAWRGLPFHNFFHCWNRPTAKDAVETTLTMMVGCEAAYHKAEEREREAKAAAREEEVQRVRKEYADLAAERQRSADNQAALMAAAHDTVTGGYYQAPPDNPADAADAANRAAQARYTHDLERYNSGAQNWAPAPPSR